MDRISKEDKSDIMKLQSLELEKLLDGASEDQPGSRLNHGAEETNPWKIIVFDQFSQQILSTTFKVMPILLIGGSYLSRWVTCGKKTLLCTF